MAHSLYDIRPLLPLIEQGCVLLTPNTRLARRVKLEWDAHQRALGATVWEPPPVQPLEQWLLASWMDAVRRGELPPSLLLTRTQELLRWQRVIEQQAGSAALVSLLRPAAAAELAQEARDRLLRWRLDYRAPRLRQLFRLEQDCEHFHAWLEAFDNDLARSGQCTTADALAALASTRLPPNAPQVALLECGEIPPLDSECLRLVSREVQLVASAPRACEVVIHPFDDERAEFGGVARWAERHHREHPGTTLGIVLSGSPGERTTLEYLLRREFGCLGRDYHSLPVNFSAGIRLVDAPVVRDALLALRMGLPRAAVADVETLLRSRFLLLPDRDSTAVSRFVHGLRDGGSAELDSGSLRYFANRVSTDDGGGLVLGRNLLAMQRERSLGGQHPPSVWARLFNGVLDIWGWPGSEPLDTLEYQQVRRWEETLDEFRGFDAVSAPLDYGAALALLIESCERQVSQPRTVDSPVQVLGPLEAVGLQFDHLWLCGMQAGNWPAAPRPNPLIPLRLQVQHDMPHASAAREWTFSEELIARYRRANRTLHASYSRARDGVPELPSALLTGFEERPSRPGEGTYPEWLRRQAAGLRERLADHQAPPLDAAELSALRGGAALLEDQSQCPFRAFAQRRLHVAAPADSVPGVSPLERGNLVHTALQVLWASLGDHTGLIALDAAGRSERVHQATRAALETLPAHRRLAIGQACLELETDRLHSLLLEWLTVEARRGTFVVQALEEEIDVALGGLVMRLRVDRIDRLEDGSQVIIDYKTGLAKAGDWLGERPRKPQLPLYGVAAATPPAALAFAQLRPGDCAFAGLGRIEGIPGVDNDLEKAVGSAVDWEALNNAWRDVLEGLADDFAAGDARVDPLRDACRWCGLQPLCRVHAPPEDEAAEEAP